LAIQESEFRHTQLPIGGASLHVIEAGDPAGRPFLFLHGWPESWLGWRDVLSLAGESVRAIAIDLPGIGGSVGVASSGNKRDMAAIIHELIAALRLEHLVLVGQDVGGMVAYAYLRAYQDVERAVLMDTVIPGIDPWDAVLRNPFIWHFAMHSIPQLPETLVQGKQRPYFDFFYNVISAHPERITDAARAAYCEAYTPDSALTAGFDWYRAFQRDAAQNRAASKGAPCNTPTLYLRGEKEGGDINEYLAGFRAAGMQHVEADVILDAGHFAQEEAPAEVWKRIAAFAGVA
jgi:pimeloyl-ACP methyl ester carboxylesterase